MMEVNVTVTNKCLGTGSYGSVFEVVYNGTEHAAKQIHEILLNQENYGTGSMLERFNSECQLMSNLSHPNITKFVGLYYQKGTQAPLLVMEKLETNLDDVLEFVPNLHLAVKLPILEDVCNGLVYLHGQQLPVIHRDLTARNILLTNTLEAKITDMGNSRIIGLVSGRQLTQAPGTLSYMPPEALEQNPTYGLPLDVFSFGHLALYTLTQVFPGTLKLITYPDPHNSEKVIARTELERREEYLNKLDDIGQFHPVLPHLVRQCLNNTPKERPTSEMLLDWVKKVRVNEEKRGNMEVDKIKLLLTLRKNLAETRLQELQKTYETAARRIGELVRQLEDQEKIYQSIEERYITEFKSNLEERCQDLDARIEELQTKVASLQKRYHTAERRNGELERQLQDAEMRYTTINESNSNLKERCREADTRIRELETRVASLKDGKSILTFNIQKIDGQEGQPLVIQDKIYMKCITKSGLTEVKVFDTTSESTTWHSLPLPSTSILPDCAMVTIQGKLALIGGHYLREPSSIVERLRTRQRRAVAHNQSTWDCTRQKWEQSLNGDTVTNCVATTYKDWIILVGYRMAGDNDALLKLKKYDTEHTISIPSLKLRGNVRSCLAGDMWFILSETEDSSDNIYRFSLQELIECVTTSNTDISSMWETQHLPHYQSAPVCINDTLFLIGGAVCGTARRFRRPVYTSLPTILCYRSDINEYVKAGGLPFPVRKCTCTMTTNDNFFMIGGENCEQSFLNGEIFLTV